jgi:hypothetical protein
MSVSTQKQALTAGFRTAAQTFQASLIAITAGGAILGATSLADINWVSLGGAFAFALIVAGLSGLNSYLNFTINGVPAQYTAPVAAPVAVVAAPVPVESAVEAPAA